MRRCGRTPSFGDHEPPTADLMRRPLLVAVLLAVACRGEESDRARPDTRSSQVGYATATCLDYRDTVELRGTLQRETHPGPPNYESIAGGDAAETGFYLHLGRAICARSSRPDPDDASETEQDGVLLVQLVLDSAGYARLGPQVGRNVTLRGTIFSAHTGHHHAPLLLDVQR